MCYIIGMEINVLKEQAKGFLTYSGKLNARVKKSVQYEFLKAIRRYFPLCESFNEAVYCVLKSLKPINIQCPVCKKEKKKFYRFSGGYFKTCGNIKCKTSNRVSWIKGLTKETDKRVALLSQKLSLSKKGKPQSKAQQKHVRDMADNNVGKKRDPVIFKKMEVTSLKKYGVKNALCLKKNKEKARISLFNKYGGYYPSSEEFQKDKEAIFDKMRQTNIKKYGVPYATQNAEVKAKIFKTKKKRGNLHKSIVENSLYSKLSKRFKVLRHYSEERYPYSCDFYIPDLDLFIELQAHWTHGTNPYDPDCMDHQKMLRKWKRKSKTYFNSAIATWTKRDVAKKQIVEKNKLNMLFVYEPSASKAFRTINKHIFDTFYKGKYTLSYRKLELKASKQRLLDELSFMEIMDLSVWQNCYYSPNIFVESFQETFYQKENLLWKDPLIREKLVSNRVYYLKKDPELLRDKDLLKGFRISGIYRGYSNFSIMPLKGFIKDFGIKSIYDPCGGWGHRYLGSLGIDYLYADNNKDRYEGVQAIHKFVQSNMNYNGTKVFKLWDSTANTPEVAYDAVFTCPPYHNIEDYGGELGYSEWLNVWWRDLIRSSIKNCNKYFAFVINYKYKADMLDIVVSEGLRLLQEAPLKTLRDHFQKNSNKQDYLLIFSI